MSSFQSEPKKVKFKTSMRGVDIVQTVYALLIALGLREVFVAFYTIFLEQRVSRSENLYVAIALFCNVILLSVRFFWVPRNFRRLYFVSEYCMHIKGTAMPAYEASAHILIILAHGALHFLLCKEFEYFVFVTTSYDALTTTAFATYIFLHATLLILNGLWLIFVNAREQAIRNSAGDPGVLRSNSESQLWARSNLVFALVAVAPLALFSSCQSASFAVCLPAAYSDSQRPLAVIPTSSYNIAAVFDLTVRMFSGAGLSSQFLLAMWAMTFLAANSIIDLFLTANYYVTLEDVETEHSFTEIQRSEASGP